MLTPMQKQLKKAQDKDNLYKKEVVDKCIPVPPITKVEPNTDYYVKIQKYYEDSTTYLWMSSALSTHLPRLLTFFSKTDTFEVALLDEMREGHSSTTLFQMFMDQGKVAVVIYVYEDIPLFETRRVLIAGDLKDPNKEEVDIIGHFGEKDFYKAYRRNFIDLKLAQEVARQYLKKGTCSDKVLWDEFLW